MQDRTLPTILSHGSVLNFVRKVRDLIFLVLVFVGSAFTAWAGTCTVDATQTNQYIRGFGAASAWNGASSLSSYAQTLWAVDNVNGHVGLSMLRTRIDPNDTGSGSSWNSEAAPMTLAKGVNPNILIWSTEWSPPAAYKGNNNVNGGSASSTFTGTSSGSANSADTGYAAYLTRYVQYIQSKFGVSLYGVSINNEPNFNPTYEACLWSAGQFDIFVPTLHSDLQNAGLSTKIIFPEPDNTGGMNLASTTMNDTNAAPMVSVLATHLYGSPNPAPLTSYGYTHLTSQDWWETEISDVSGAGPDNSMTSALTEASWVHNCMANSKMNAFHHWWIWGSDNSALITSSGVSKKLMILGNYSKFVRPGFYRMGATTVPSSGVSVTAYKNTNTSSPATIVIVAINGNNSATSQTFSLTGLNVTSVIPWVTDGNNNLVQQGAIAVSNNSFTYSLTGPSVVSFVGVNNGGTVSTPTRTNTPVPPTATNTSTRTAVPPTSTFTATSTRTNTATSTSTFTFTATSTRTNTPVPPTSTNTSTRTAVPPTSTFTPVPPTATSTSTAVPPTATSTFTPIPPTATNTSILTAVPPTTTYTSVPPTATWTFTAIPPTASPTFTSVPQTATNTSTLTAVPPTWTYTSVPPTATSTFTAIPPTVTTTSTPVPPTATYTSTRTAVPPTSTFTSVPPTATFTATQVVSSANFKVQLLSGVTSATTNSPHPQIQVVNTGSGPLALNSVQVKYWFNCDCTNQSIQAWADWAGLMPAGSMATGNVSLSIQATALGGQTNAMVISFTGNLVLQPGQTIQVQTRFNKNDWSNMSQGNDWSFAANTAFVDAPHVTGYMNGARVWGQEPSGTTAALTAASVRPYPNPSTGNGINFSVQISGSGVVAASAGIKGQDAASGVGLDPSAQVVLKAFTLDGRLIWSLTLPGSEFGSTGNHNVYWNERDPSGATLANGVYNAEIEVKSQGQYSRAFTRVVILR